MSSAKELLILAADENSQMDWIRVLSKKVPSQPPARPDPSVSFLSYLKNPVFRELNQTSETLKISLQGGVSISAHIRVPIIRLNWVPIIREFNFSRKIILSPPTKNSVSLA